MIVSHIEADVVTGTIEISEFSVGSYIARVIQTAPVRLITIKSFGNGVSAQDWILEEMQFPLSVLLLKYA